MPEPTNSGTTKPVHTIILDAGPLLKNVPPVSTLLAQSETLLTPPSIISEIRDPDARTRVETMYLPFVTLRAPNPNSMKVVSEFARKTGDRAVLSRVDLEVLALAYEVECERNGGDWRLRREPGQKGINGKPPVKEDPVMEEKVAAEADSPSGEASTEKKDDAVDHVTEGMAQTTVTDEAAQDKPSQPEAQQSPEDPDTATITEDATAAQSFPVEEASEEEEEGESDGGEWITPSNIKKRQARDEAASTSASTEPKVMQVATLTTDFAMQNVLLQMNLNILSTTTLQQIRHLRTYILRCHACFLTTKEMNKQFCPRCGKPTLTRVSCSTDSNGAFKMHLKRNMQWNTRGDRYSIPKPIAGSANGKWKGGGGQGGWGQDLVLAEDQKEYVRAMAGETRRAKKERDLMDEDYLPGILTGERNKSGGRVKVGAGRNVNSRKRK